MTSETDALIERLRRHIAVVRDDCARAGFMPPPYVGDCEEAADLIAAQRDALEAIARGEYDGLEVHPHSAAAGRAIARRALGREV